ncbi:hypothetical protein JTI77_15840, partial [Vibrio furnissii]
HQAVTFRVQNFAPFWTFCTIKAQLDARTLIYYDQDQNYLRENSAFLWFDVFIRALRYKNENQGQ